MSTISLNFYLKIDIVYNFIKFNLLTDLSEDNMKKKNKSTNESMKVDLALNGFNAETCYAKHQLDFYFSTGVSHNELKSIARVVCNLTGLKLNRLALRYKCILIKWFDDNWLEIENVIQCIQLFDEDDKPITLARELNKE